MRKNSIKNTRINGEVQKVLAEVIRGEIKDPRIPEFTSIVSVEVAPDLKNCKAYVSVLGDDEKAAEALEGLKSASGFIRNRLAKELNLRNTPDLHFYLDQSIAYGVDMSKKIDEVIRADEEKSRQ
ncbi:MAG: 30S ribosome-binding factor RbfA [Lachnospiraceae bacterium]|jgi:ribosome-binding factor A|nr:30S ribosome-binding factor RbfA [Lachnospiraceae bacterium]